MERRSGRDRRDSENGLEILGEFSGSAYMPDDGLYGMDNCLEVLSGDSPEGEVLDFDGWMRAIEKNSRAVATLCIAMSGKIEKMERTVAEVARIMYSMAARK